MSERAQNDTNEENPHQQKLDAYIRELLAEKSMIDETKSPHAYRLIDEEIQRAQASGRLPYKDQKFVDIYRERPVKVGAKVLIPAREHPRYNFIGKLLGPKGNTLKQLQDDTMCHISICGRGSIRDRQKEEELRQSLEPKYAHLFDDLHMDISTLGPPAEAHARIAFALAEIRKYLIPDYNDVNRQEPLMEMMPNPKPVIREDRPPTLPPRKPGTMMAGGARRPPPGVLGATRNAGSANRMGPKSKVMSILDRARVAMEEYEEDYDGNEPQYENYRGRPAGNARSSYVPARGGYTEEYDGEYYREGGAPYSAGGPEFGFKKRKTFMD